MLQCLSPSSEQWPWLVIDVYATLARPVTGLVVPRASCGACGFMGSVLKRGGMWAMSDMIGMLYSHWSNNGDASFFQHWVMLSVASSPASRLAARQQNEWGILSGGRYVSHSVFKRDKSTQTGST